MTDGDSAVSPSEVRASTPRPSPLWKVYSWGRLRALYSIVKKKNGARSAKVTAQLSCPADDPPTLKRGREAI